MPTRRPSPTPDLEKIRILTEQLRRLTRPGTEETPATTGGHFHVGAAEGAVETIREGKSTFEDLTKQTLDRLEAPPAAS